MIAERTKSRTGEPQGSRGELGNRRNPRMQLRLAGVFRPRMQQISRLYHSDPRSDPVVSRYRGGSECALFARLEVGTDM